MMHFGLVMPSVVLVCLSVVLSGCGSGDMTATTTPPPTPTEHLKWMNYHIEQTGGGFGLSVGVDGTVFWAGESELDSTARLTAFDGDDGAFYWDLNNDVLGTYVGKPVVGPGNSLYMRTVNHTNNSVLAVERGGTRKWIQNFNKSEPCLTGVEALVGAGTTILVGSDGTVFTSRYCLHEHGGNASLFALDGDDGTIKWQSPVGDLTGLTLVMASDNTIIFTDDSCHVFAVQGTDGLMKWNVTIPCAHSNVRSSSSPSLGANGTILVCTDDGLVALDGKDGSVKWKQEDACNGPFEGHMPFQTGWQQSLFGAAAGSDGTVFVRSSRTSNSTTVALFHALDDDDGSIRWTKEISNMECDGPMHGPYQAKPCSFTMAAVSTDSTRVYVGLGSRVYGFDAQSGNTVWHSHIEVESVWNNALDQGNIPPVLGPDGTVFICSPRTIYALYPESILAA